MASSAAIQNIDNGGIYFPLNGNGDAELAATKKLYLDGANPASSGFVVYNTSCARNGNSGDIDLNSDHEILIYPGETVTLIANVQATGDVQVTLNWDEDI